MRAPIRVTPLQGQEAAQAPTRSLRSVLLRGEGARSSARGKWSLREHPKMTLNQSEKNQLGRKPPFCRGCRLRFSVSSSWSGQVRAGFKGNRTAWQQNAFPPAPEEGTLAPHNVCRRLEGLLEEWQERPRMS